MAKARDPRLRRKRHNSERFRGPNLLVERWSNAKCGFLGFFIGSGKSSIEAARLLGDGTSPETIRSIIKKWHLPATRVQGKRPVLIMISGPHSRKLDEQAEKLGVTQEEYARRILEEAVQHVLYNAITDGRFDDKL